MKTSEKLAHIGSILDELFKTTGEYISFEYARHSATNCHYNIYSSTLNHNRFSDYDEFINFLSSLARDNFKNIRKKTLNERLKECRVRSGDLQEMINEINNELEQLEHD